jgi:hypothetical protein
MIGKVDGASQGNYPGDIVGLYGPITLSVPLRFWFCKTPGLYLPLLALQYHPVRINITLRPLQSLFVYDHPNIQPNDITVQNTSITSMNLYGDYVHLDVEERRRFVANSHEYLIEQVQYTSSYPIDSTANTVQIPLEFNHPIREMYWFVQRDVAANAHQWFNYSNFSIGESGILQNQISTSLIRVEGYDRFDIRNADYFRLVQPFQCHTVVPADTYVYSYSFCFRPEDMQPSGSMNASRLNTLTLQLQFPNNPPLGPTSILASPVRGTANARVYALNYNILRIVDGYGGILFRV